MDEYLNIQALYKLPFLRTEWRIRNNVTRDLLDNYLHITYTYLKNFYKNSDKSGFVILYNKESPSLMYKTLKLSLSKFL